MYRFSIFQMRVCFSNHYKTRDRTDIELHIRYLKISCNPEESMSNATYPRSLRADAIYISSTQAIVRQMRAQIGRSVSPSYHLLPTCNYDRFHRTLKSVAQSWQYVCCTRVACRSRSAIIDLISRCRRVIQNLRLRWNIHSQDHIDQTNRHCTEKTRAKHFRIILWVQTLLFVDIFARINFNYVTIIIHDACHIIIYDNFVKTDIKLMLSKI